MRRRSVLRGIGLLGIGAATQRWAGDPNLIRRDLNEGKTGVPLTLAICVVDAAIGGGQ